MTTGLVLILAILVLGGVIATMGDRIGMKVGKSRLSLFGLRPRQTATLVTILTGILISASTFGILFAFDDQLRTGVFELEDIQAERDTARAELNQAQRETASVQRQRDRAQSQQRTAQQRLRRINRSLQQAIAQENRTRQALGTTQERLSQVAANYQQAQTRLGAVSQQADSLRREIQQLQGDRQQEIAKREQAIAERDQRIADRDREIAAKENQLSGLEDQRRSLIAEVQTLEREFQGLRQGSVALLRNQPMASGVVRVVDPTAAPQAVDRLLREANRFASQRLQPGTNTVDKQVIQIISSQVEQVASQIRDGQDYVVRVVSAGNYVIGEPCVLAGEACIQVYVAAAPNQVVFRSGDVIAEIDLNSVTMNDERLIERINLLIANTQFRARQVGILGDVIQIADGRPETIIEFLQQVKLAAQLLNVQAVIAETTYTAGPVRLELVALSRGQPLFGTALPLQLEGPSDSDP